MTEPWPLEVVMSGGQTGADQGGLRAAKVLGYSTYGFAPRGWITEAGPAPWLGSEYGLVQSRHVEYQHRTAQNVRHADGTIVFYAANVLGVRGGSHNTIAECTAQGKPCLVLPVELGIIPAWHWDTMTTQIRQWIVQHRIVVVNIAGNRESVAPGIGARVEAILTAAFTKEPSS